MNRAYKTPETEFPDDVYELQDSAATRALYRDWADSYDADLVANGYASPARCAQALGRFVEDRSAPLLDIGWSLLTLSSCRLAGSHRNANPVSSSS